MKVTDWPKYDGFKLEVRVVEVGNLFTFWARTTDALLWKFESPWYFAEMPGFVPLSFHQ